MMIALISEIEFQYFVASSSLNLCALALLMGSDLYD